MVRATLSTDSLQKSTPTVNSVKAIAWDTGTYSQSGQIVTKSISVTEPSKALILELHGKANGGSFTPSITVNGIVIPGVLTSSQDLVTPKPGDTGDPNGGSSGLSPLEQAAAQLRTEVSSKNLTAYYYKFTLPDNLTTGAFTGHLTLKNELIQ